MRKYGNIDVPSLWAASLSIVGFCALIMVTGCGPNDSGTAIAKGQVVTADGQPCAGALVVFHPQESERINDPKPVATTDADGKFELTTHAANDGAVPGKYGVTIVWNQPAKDAAFSLSDEGGGGKDKLGGRYGDPGNPKLEAIVEPGKQNEYRFEVK